MSDEAKKEPKNVPDLAAAAAAFTHFCRTVAALRDPVSGCPWDQQQTHESLRRYMIEEAYEASEAMGSGEPLAICDELGDVLLQVVLNAQLALDHNGFSIVDVIRGIDRKMQRRHPHVFGDETATSPEQVRERWAVIKAQERGETLGGERTFAKAARGGMPATLQALKIGEIAARIHFDWTSPHAVFQQLCAEVDELKSEVLGHNREGLLHELGDVYFTLAQLCRHLGVDPESAALRGNQKFLARFARVEDLAAARGIQVSEAPAETLEGLWNEAKRLETKEAKK